MIWCGSGSTFEVWTAIIGSNRNARSIRLASQVSWNAAPSPSKGQGRSTVATLMDVFVGVAQEPLFHRAVGRAVDDLDGAVADRHRRHDANDLRRFDARQAKTRPDFFQLHSA